MICKNTMKVFSKKVQSSLVSLSQTLPFYSIIPFFIIYWESDLKCDLSDLLFLSFHKIVKRCWKLGMASFTIAKFMHWQLFLWGQIWSATHILQFYHFQEWNLIFVQLLCFVIKSIINEIHYEILSLLEQLFSLNLSFWPFSIEFHVFVWVCGSFFTHAQ